MTTLVGVLVLPPKMCSLCVQTNLSSAVLTREALCRMWPGPAGRQTAEKKHDEMIMCNRQGDRSTDRDLNGCHCLWRCSGICCGRVRSARVACSGCWTSAGAARAGGYGRHEPPIGLDTVCWACGAYVAMFRTAVERLLAADKGKHGDDGLSAALDAGTKRATLALQLALDRAGRF